MGNIQAHSTPTTPSSRDVAVVRNTAAPAYIPAVEQAFEIHKNAASAAQTNADMYSGFAEALQMLSRAHPNPPAGMDAIVHSFAQKAIQSGREAVIRNEGLQNARKVTKYYETPINKPAYPTVHDQTINVRVNLKEIAIQTGFFDPADKTHDFKHIWQKLLKYGSRNDYQESHYMEALGSILKNEAYETFMEFEETGKSLEEILDYFANVYTKKRSLADDRKAVDEFTRRKGENIQGCMGRAILAIDKLRHLYGTQGWPALRQSMRQNILMQVVKEDTKRAVQMEIDHVYEDTGMPYDFEKLIQFAERYERNHNTAPKDEMTTVFKVASGGLHSKKDNKSPNPTEQLSHLKKDQMLQKTLDTIQTKLATLEANEARFYKNEGRPERSRDSRRNERDSRSRERRSSTYDRNRQMDKTASAAKETPSTQTTTRPTSSTPTRVTYNAPNPYAKREQSRSPNRRGQTPAARPEDDRNRSGSQYRSDSQNRNRNRSFSNNRNRDQRSASKTTSRSGSTHATEGITSSGSRTVNITVNGQSYGPLNKEN
jgi:hypothetical protein